MSNLHMGDCVIVINADKVRVTGNKLAQKMYYRHSGYPGGIRQQTLQNVLDKKPTNAIKSAVKGMLPKTKLGRRMLSRLKLYAGGEHPHAAQVNARPKIVEAAAPAVAEQAAPPAEAAVKAPPAPKRRRASKPKAAAKEPVAAEQAEAAPEPDPPAPTRRRKAATKPAAEGAAGTPDEPAAKPPTARKKRASRAKPKSTDHQEE
jgi:hypothetical protein